VSPREARASWDDKIGQMLMVILHPRWMAVAGALLAALVALIVSGRRRKVTLEDAGSVSGDWIARQRWVRPDD
jgi:LPXTG-motif cell wall-anchored protein